MEKRRESIIDSNNKELTPKQQVARMLAAKRKEQSDAPTFKPKLVSGGSKSFGESTDLASSRFDRLYGDAKSRQAKAQVEEVRRSRELDFKPKITSRGASRERSDSARYSESGAGRVSAKVTEATEKSTPSFVPEITRRASSIDRSHSQQKTGDRLYSAAQTFKERTEKRKAELEKKASAENTFQPKLNAPRRSASADGRAPAVTPAEVSARQKKYETDRAKRREELLKAKEERETKELLLKPKINDNPALLPASVASTTVFERLQNPTTKDLSELAQQLDSELTFRPKLAPYVSTSSSAADSAGEGGNKGDIHSRLYQEGIQKLQQRQLEAEKVQQEALEKLTFQPTLPHSPAASASALTAANLAANAGIGGADTVIGAGFGEGSQTGTTRTSSSVFDRLTSTNKAQAADMLLQIKTQLDLQECTFKPTVHAPPSSSGSVDGAAGSIFERLQRDAEMQRKKLEKLEAERVEKEKMQLQSGPNIPQSSREILSQKKSHSPPKADPDPQSPPSSPSGRRTSLLFGAKEKEQGRASSPHKSFPPPHPQYSFKPTIPQSSTELAGKPSDGADIYTRLQRDANEHQKRLSQLDKAKADKELEGLLSSPLIPASSKELAEKRKKSRASMSPVKAGADAGTKAEAEAEMVGSVAVQVAESGVAVNDPFYAKQSSMDSLAASTITISNSDSVATNTTTATSSSSSSSGNGSVFDAFDFSPSVPLMETQVQTPTVLDSAFSDVPVSEPATSPPTEAAPAPKSTEAAAETPQTRSSKVEELRARLAKQKTEREKLKAASGGVVLSAPAPAAAAADAEEEDQTF